MAVGVVIFDPRVTPDHIGMIPYWLNEGDPRPAKEQLNEHYQHGGGWNPFEGFDVIDDHMLTYPGDPPLRPFAYMQLRDEDIYMYDHAWVAIFQKDGSYEVCRMD